MQTENLIHTRTVSQRSMFQVFQTGLGMVVFQVFAFVSGILIARGLGPEGQGKFQLLTSTTILVASFAKLGLDEGLAYLLSKYRVNAPQKLFSIVIYVLSLTTAIGVTLGIVFFLSADFLERFLFRLPGFALDLRFALVLIPVTMLLFMGTATLRGLGRSDLRAYVYYYAVGGTFVLLLLVLYPSGLNNSDAYLARIASFGLGTLLSLVIIGRSVKRGRWSLSMEDLRKLHTFSGYLIMAGAFQYIIEQPLIDLILVGRVGSAEEVGIYSVAARASALVAMGTMAMTVVMAPVLAEYVARRDSEGLMRQYAFASEWMARLSMFAGISLLLLRDELLGLFGSEYSSGVEFLVILLVAQVTVGLMGLNAPLLLAADYAWVELVLTSIAASTMLIFGILLGGQLGAKGIAIAAASAIVLLSVGRRVACGRLFRLKAERTTSIIFIGLLSGVIGFTIQSLLPIPSVFATTCALAGTIVVFWGLTYATGIELNFSSWRSK